MIFNILKGSHFPFRFYQYIGSICLLYLCITEHLFGLCYMSHYIMPHYRLNELKQHAVIRTGVVTPVVTITISVQATPVAVMGITKVEPGIRTSNPPAWLGSRVTAGLTMNQTANL